MTNSMKMDAVFVKSVLTGEIFTQTPQVIAGYFAADFTNTFQYNVKSTIFDGALVMENCWSSGSFSLGPFIQLGTYTSMYVKYTNPMTSEEQSVFTLEFIHEYGHDYNPIEQDANARAIQYFYKKTDGNFIWHFDENPIGYPGTNWTMADYNTSKFQSLLSTLKVNPTWYDYAGWGFGLPGAIFGAATGMLSLGIGAALQYGGKMLVGYNSFTGRDKTILTIIGGARSINNYFEWLPGTGSLIEGVSNTSLEIGALSSSASDLTGSLAASEFYGQLNMSLLPRSKPGTLPDISRDWLDYSASMVNTYRSSGTLTWYHNGDVIACYSAVSGSGPSAAANTPAYTIPGGDYTASNYRLLGGEYSHNGVGFGIDLSPGQVYDPLQGCFRDEGFMIHPTNGGTLGCIGLTGDRCELLDFQSRISTYLSINHSINVHVY